VHSFAGSAVGPVLLGFLAALIVGVGVLALLRADRLGTPHEVGPPVSRGAALLLNNVLLLCVAAVVLIGTLFPLVAQWLSGTDLSVGAPYYDRTAVPVLVLLLLLMAVGPSLSWRGEPLATALSRLLLPLFAGVCVVVVLALSAPTGGLPLLAIGLSVVVAAATLRDVGARVRTVRARQGTGLIRAAGRWLRQDRRRACGMLAHLGLVLLAVGVAASSAYTSTTERTLRTGQRVSSPGLGVELLSVHRDRTAAAVSTTATLRVTQGSHTSLVHPALRFFPDHDTTVASPSLVNRVRGDLYVTLLSTGAGGRSTVRIAVKPLVGWIWAGGAVMVAGGAGALWPRRRRPPVGATAEVPPAREPEPEVVG